MFNKLKQYKDLRHTAKKMQNAMAQESITIEKSGVKVVVNGNMEIVKISINEELAKDSLESILADNINDALKKAQRLMAEKMQAMGGLGNLHF